MAFANRWYQDDGQAAIINFLQTQEGNPLAVFPTGTGKSVIIAQLIAYILRWWPSQRVMMLTHDKTLITQNASKLIQMWPEAPLGVYSAGLNSREVMMPIIFAGIQSVSKEIQRATSGQYLCPLQSQHFGHRDILFVDEAHLISQKEDSDYLYVLRELLKINPYLRVVGFTATPYRVGQGMVTDGGIFTHICYDISGLEEFNRLIREGYLSMLIPRPTVAGMDMSKARPGKGDYTEKAMNEALQEEIMYDAVRELVDAGNTYNLWSWLSFAPSIKRAEQLNEMLQSLGVESTVVHSGLKKNVVADRIHEFKNGYHRSIVNKDMLTTGFDHPPIDLIGMFRPTTSPGLWVQMLGRGTRPYDPNNPGDVNPFFTKYKDWCMVMDFARNTPRLGPINDPVVPRKPGQSGGDAPVRTCPKDKKDHLGNIGCGTHNHSSAKECVFCGFVFPITQKIDAYANSDVLVAGDGAPEVEPTIEYLPVSQVFYAPHKKNGAPPSIKVTYVCGMRSFYEWVCLEHSGYAGRIAKEWWTIRHNEAAPFTTANALQKVSELRKPKTLRVNTGLKHPQILSVEW